MKKSAVPTWIAQHVRALLVLCGVAGAGGGTYVAYEQVEAARRDEYVIAVSEDESTSMAVKIAMVIGRYYESSGRHIGKPYIDKVGRGQPLTVCNGITPAVAPIDPKKWYTPAECYEMERRVYIKAEDQAKRHTTKWDQMNEFQQASVIDFIHNVGIGNYANSNMRRKFNAGDFVGGCNENPKWVYAAGRVLPGLVTRRESNREICANWKI